MKIPNRLLKRLFPALLLTEAILVWTHVLDAGTAIAVGAAVESLTFLVGLRQMVVALLCYRQSRASGFDVQTALEEGLTVILPRRVARIVALEPRIWICLYQWATRHPLTATEFSYSKRSIVGVMLAFVLITGPFEILAYEILLPWAMVRLVLLLATLYMALWMIGLYASMKVLPYRLEDEGIRLHYGILADGYIPYVQIAKIWVKQEQTRASREGLMVNGDSAYLTAGGHTDVTLRLREPRPLNGLLATTVPVTYIHLVADQPDALAHALAERAGLKANNPPPTLPALGNLAAAMLCVCVLPIACANMRWGNYAHDQPSFINSKLRGDAIRPYENSKLPQDADSLHHWPRKLAAGYAAPDVAGGHGCGPHQLQPRRVRIHRPHYR